MSHPIIYKIMKKKENSYTASQIRSLKHSPYRAPEYYAENSQTTNEADHWAHNNKDQSSLQWKFDIVWCILLWIKEIK